MYAPFFGLKQEPFSIAPDPRYLFMSERHREALAHLLYGLNGGGGFVLLTGEIGAGKTTVCRCFLEQIPRRCNVAYVFNPKLSGVELLKTVCEEFGIPPPEPHAAGVPATVKDYLDPLNEYLLRTHSVGQDNVLIIDEAQMLAADVLEQLRLLTNLETNERKLLQIILIGQPELRTLLARPELEQLAQRVIARFHLEALSESETAQYVAHRLGVAGLAAALPFDAAALRRIHALTRGVPRRINLLCDRALLGAYARGERQVGRVVVDQAAREVFGPADSRAGAGLGTDSARGRIVLVGLGLAVGAGLAAVGAVALDAGRRPPTTLAVSTGPASASAPASARPVSPVPPAPQLARAASAASAASAPSADGPPAAAASAAITLTGAEIDDRFKAAIRDERQAWRELAPLWGLPAQDGDPCQTAERGGVRCYRSAGSTLALIRQLGRPGILTLRDARNAPVYALLTGLGPRSASVRMGGTVQTVSLVSLAQLWRGDFATFWRVPGNYDGKVIDADSGAAADWLAAQLARVDGDNPATGDAALRSRISAFQLAQGLKADGLAGPTTLMQLNRALGVDEPRLPAEPASY